MKKLILIMGVGGAMAATSAFAAFDGNVTMNGGTYEYGNGGEFTAVSSGLGTFTTFCLELNEEFGLGNNYQYIKNSGAVMGDAGALATDAHTGLKMDNLSIGTAWLYSQFRSGGIVINSVQAAGDFQNAIWFLENEIGSLSYNGADGTTYYNLAKAIAGGGTDAGVMADSNGAYGVVALNLYNGAYGVPVQVPGGTDFAHGDTVYLNQDMLAIVPEPTTMLAGALLLLPFGASTIRIFRKNRAA